jgi:predicted membrane channel-forming protein YqfA (hemolysin III family)
MTQRPQTLEEEIANSVSHVVALIADVASVPFLMASERHQNATSFVGTIVFAATMVLLYLASTLYHVMPEGRAKRTFCKLDHGASFVKARLGACTGVSALVFGPILVGAVHTAFLTARCACPDLKSGDLCDTGDHHAGDVVVAVPSVS